MGVCVSRAECSCRGTEEFERAINRRSAIDKRSAKREQILLCLPPESGRYVCRVHGSFESGVGHSDGDECIGDFLFIFRTVEIAIETVNGAAIRT